MTEREFVELVRRMRAAQQVYFQCRAPSNLKRAKALEHEVDRELEQRTAAEAPKQATFF